MIVVKLGGSLFDYPKLSGWLKILSEEGAGNVVIVPGGGPFADQVRDAQKRWNFSDKQAHQMALHAMDQFGLMLNGVAAKYGYDLIPANSKQEIHEILASKKTSVCLPSTWLKNKKEIPQNWTVTSDSLSVWLAKELKADQLILIKRIKIDGDATIKELGKANIVDDSFDEESAKKLFKNLFEKSDYYDDIVKNKVLRTMNEDPNESKA